MSFGMIENLVNNNYLDYKDYTTKHLIYPQYINLLEI